MSFLRRNRRAETWGVRRGAVLIIVLIVVVMLSLAAYAFATLMLQQYDGAKLSGKQLQSRMIVESGVEATRLFLSQDETILLDAGGTYDNPMVFQGQLVVPEEDPNLRGRYTILAPALDEEGNVAGIRYGLEDESTRLNINSLLLADETIPNGGRMLLMGIPGMNEEIADCILDWIDENDEPREYGAELDYYSGLQPSYAPKNGPLETIEELLLVKGIREAPFLLFGTDPYRSGIPVMDQELGAATGGSGAATLLEGGSLGRGWSAYMTLFSKEANVNADGARRVYINQADLEKLYAEVERAMGDNWATFIVAYRQFGPAESGGEEQPRRGDVKLDFEQPAQFTFVQSLDLIGATTQVPGEDGEDPQTLSSPINELNLGFELPKVMDNLTVNDSVYIPGRVNVNQAPRFILQALIDMLIDPEEGRNEEIIENIISRRDIVPDPEDPDPNRKFETWLMADLDPILTLDEMKLLLPFICVGGDVHRAQVIGYYEGGGTQNRAEVILDGTATYPKVAFWRDVSHLPHGYPLEILGLDLMSVVD